MLPSAPSTQLNPRYSGVRLLIVRTGSVSLSRLTAAPFAMAISTVDCQLEWEAGERTDS
jgi:hypothetical protein